jgi:hypothetical protein
VLLPHHQALLEASGISEEVAGKRSYFSATTGTVLRDLGFGRSQLSVPALVIPLFDVHGEAFGYQARPDQPRQIRGKTVKYETPAKQPNRIDVPPSVREMLDDPAVPVIFTEGSRKADSAASRGMCCVSLNGVYGWRHTNGKGGKVVVPDLGAIALNRRVVVLVFDSDSMIKVEVHQALSGFAAFLGMRHANVLFAYLPPQPSGAKTGLDDWLAADPARGFTELDALCRAKLDDLEATEKEDTFDDVTEESGALLLNDVRTHIRRYVMLPSAEAETTATLWTAHSHVFDADDVSPNLFARSPIKGSGKTRLLEVLELLVRRPRRAVNISLSALFRLVEREQPTILLDEVDRFIGWRPGARLDERKEDMIGLLNSSFRRGETVMRMVGEGAAMTPQEFRLYTPLAMAGLGRLPDTLQDRSFVITLQRKAPGVKVTPFRRREAEKTLLPVQRRLAAWAKRNGEAVGATRPVMPETVTDRAADKWEVLLQVAAVAGGDWPDLASAAAEAFTRAERDEDEDENLELRLLHDLAATWPKDKTEWPSTSVVDALNVLSDAPWMMLGRAKKGLTTTRLANMLRPFGVIPSRPSDHRGAMEYQLEQMVATWGQYGVDLPDWCACQVGDPPTNPAQPCDPAQMPSDQDVSCAGLETSTLRNPAQLDDDTDGAQGCADLEDSTLRNESAGQDPNAQTRRVAQGYVGDSETDMHVDDVLGGVKSRPRRRRNSG